MPDSVPGPPSPSSQPLPPAADRGRVQLPSCVYKNLTPEVGFLCSCDAFGRSSTVSASLGSLNRHFLDFRLDRKVLTSLRPSYSLPLLLPAAVARGRGGARPGRRQPFASPTGTTSFRTRTIQSARGSCAARRQRGRCGHVRAAADPAPLSPECVRPGPGSAASFSDAKKASVRWNSSLPPVGRREGGAEPSWRGGCGAGDLGNGNHASADLGVLGSDFERRRSWVVSVLELVTGDQLVRCWGNSLGKKRIRCLLSINILTTATNHKTAEGPVK